MNRKYDATLISRLVFKNGKMVENKNYNTPDANLKIRHFWNAALVKKEGESNCYPEVAVCLLYTSEDLDKINYKDDKWHENIDFDPIKPHPHVSDRGVPRFIVSKFNEETRAEQFGPPPYCLTYLPFPLIDFECSDPIYIKSLENKN